MNFFRKFLMGVVVFLACSISTVNGNTVEFKRIYFAKGVPTKKDSNKELVNLLNAQQFSVAIQILDELKKRPEIKIKVLGFSDEKECVPSDCEGLSIRRAAVVFNWMKKRGITSDQLQGYEGQSTNWPLYRDATPEQSRFNRRVDFEILDLPRID